MLSRLHLQQFILYSTRLVALYNGFCCICTNTCSALHGQLRCHLNLGDKDKLFWSEQFIDMLLMKVSEFLPFISFLIDPLPYLLFLEQGSITRYDSGNHGELVSVSASESFVAFDVNIFTGDIFGTSSSDPRVRTQKSCIPCYIYDTCTVLCNQKKKELENLILHAIN